MRKFEPAMLPLTAAMASALVACSPSADVAERDLAICRDGSGRRVADSGCGSGHGGGMGGMAYYYLARGSRVPAIGEPVNGGSGTPHAGVGYARASPATVTRGGFGASAGGGEGGEGGHGGAGE